MKTLVDVLPNFAPQIADIISAICLRETRGTRPANFDRSTLEAAGGVTTFLSIIEKAVDLTSESHFEDERDKFLGRLQVVGWNLSSGLSFDEQAAQARALWDEARKPGRNRLLKTLFRYGALRGAYASVPLHPPYPSEDMCRLQVVVDAELRRLFETSARVAESVVLEWRDRVLDIQMVSNPGSKLLGFVVGRVIGETMRLLLSLPYPQIILHGSSLTWIDSAPALVEPGDPITEEIETSKGLKKIRALHQDMFLTRLSMTMDDAQWSIAALITVDDTHTAAHWLLDPDGDIVHAFGEDQEWKEWGYKNAQRLAKAKIVDALSLGRSDLRESMTNLVVNTKRWYRVRREQSAKEDQAIQVADDAVPPVEEWDGRPFPIRLATRAINGPKLVAMAAKAIKTKVEASLEGVADFVGPCSIPIDLAMNEHLEHALISAHLDVSDYILFRLEGGQMFQLPERLSRAIVDSGMEDIPMSAVHLPHQSFYLDLGMSIPVEAKTESGIPVQIGIEGLYLRDDVSPSGAKAIVITPVLDYESRLQEVSCCRVWIPQGDGTLEEQIHLGSEELRVQLEAKRNAVAALTGVDPRHQLIDPDNRLSNEMNERTRERQIRLDPELTVTIGRAVACLLCYLTQYQESAVPTLLGDKSNARAKHLQDGHGATVPSSEIDWWRFGIGHVNVFKDPFEKQDDDGKVEHATGRKLIPHLRKGSFRMQAYGPKYTLRRVRWYNPYLVNADDPRDVKQKIYHA